MRELGRPCHAVGNDVVDLRDAEARPDASHPRFAARVFTAAERAAIARAPDPTAERWALWAAKEAAFKAAKQVEPRTVWSPVRFEVVLGASGRGVVRHAGARFAVRVARDAEHVHAVAVPEGADPSRVRARVTRCPDGLDPREAVRRDLARALGRPARAIHVERTGRIPRLRTSDGASAALSLSHHGRFVAWAAGAAS